ncbi:RGS1-HXK1-interacting protein 1 isoform X1 [Solanum dulcamara]|uniref:RGS1-HXK1-interacting protein 1 isoform X1 n=1 Tax=Solanum dulcamara TaxID=45834 RepID=UPI002486062F|nr:RGS1-HXK1-interacting protein 1 isoform X1 [Solanum dulcamara]
MAAIAESSEANANSPSPSLPPERVKHEEKSNTWGEIVPWIDNAVQQAQLAQKTVENTFENAIVVTKSRLDRILTTSSAHFNQTLDTLQDLKSEYSVYEDLVFGKVRGEYAAEGLLLAASHPLATTGAFLGVGVLGLKRPRRFLYYSAMRLFVREEALLSRADAKVKELQKSIDLLKAESAKLENQAVQAEGEMIRGRTKLRQAGKQIRSVIQSAYKIERQAAGLQDVLKELPRREVSRFRSQVSNLASEAKKERNVLTKEVTKISNYGISI